MANNEAGAFLNITPDVLNKLDSFDKKLENIQNHAKTAADALKSGFSSLNTSTSTLSLTIGALAQQIEKLNSAGIAVRNIGESAQGSAKGVSSMNESISRAAQLLNQLSGRISQNTFSSFNIAGLKEGISDLKRYVENTKTISKAEQQKAIEVMRYMKMELDYQRQTDEQRAQSAERAAKRKEAADKKAYKDAANLAKAQNYQNNTTVQGALDFSKTAHTLQRQATAIEYLKKARMSLNTETKEGQTQLKAINAAIDQHNRALQQAGVQSQNLSQRYRNLWDITGQLKRQFALMFSVSQIEGYIGKVASVRGEFELTQRSLQSILQNKSKADKIFNQTVDLAVKSPFRIKELTSYTKQLAAYRIESDELFDTTKRLADVSAGLGVGMERLILAYGQVKAASYLRGSEVRQFTEAGVNMYGELQSYFKEVKGEAYTTAQIVDMISKRKVTFEDVEQIFKRMTDEGGLFYKMQETQAETLTGKISNLKDSFDIMLNDIGKSSEGALKGSIDVVKSLVDNWEKLLFAAKLLGPILASMGITLLAQKITKTNSVLELLKVGFNKAAGAAKLFSQSLKSIWIFALIAGIYEVISAFTKFNDAIAKSTNDYYEAKIRLSVIQDTSNTDIKKALNDLVKEMNNEGLEVKIKVNLSEEEAKDEYGKKLKDYEDFLNTKRAIEARWAKNDNNFWQDIVSDDLETDSKDYEAKAGGIISYAESIRPKLKEIAETEKYLSEEHKKLLEDLSKGPKKGGDILDYSKKLSYELDKISKKTNESRRGAGLATRSIELAKIYSNLSSKRNDLIGAENELKKELTEVYGAVGVYKKEHINALLKNETRLGATSKRFFSQNWNLEPKVDKKKVEKELLSVDKQVERFLKDKRYTIDLSVNTNDILSELGKFGKSIKENEELIATLGRANEGIYSGLSVSKQEYKELFGEDELYKSWTNDSLTHARISKQQYIEFLKKKNERDKKQFKNLGGDMSTLEDKKEKSGSTRDILSERLSILKEMQSRYESLKQMVGKDLSIDTVRTEFAGSLKSVGLGGMDIIPTKEGLIKAYEEILKGVKDSNKIADIKKEIANLKIEIQQEELKKQLEDTKQNIESMFNGLDLHKKLKDAGLSEAEVQQLFPGLAKNFGDVQRGMEKEYANNFKNGEYKIEGTDANKQYEDDKKKLNKQIVQEQQNLVVELTKAYKAQLSDQIQLDNWYYEEKSKITRANLTDEQKELYNKNLTSQYGEKSDENAWKQFQESDFYIDLFQNLENVSTKTLVAMRDKLGEMKEQLKDLQPSQVKAIVSNMEKLDDVLSERDSFKKLIPSLKSYISSLKDRKKHEDDYLEALGKQQTVEKRLYGETKTNSDGSKERVKGESEVLAQLQAEYNAIYENENATQEQKDEALEKLNTQKDIVKKLEEELANNKQITDQKKEQVDADKRKLDLANKILKSASSYTSQALTGVSEFTGMLESFGMETPEWLKGTMEGLGKITDGLDSMDFRKPFSVVTGAFKVVGGIGKTIGSLFGFGNNDKKKEKEIQRQIENVEKLGKAYEELKEKMDLAWSIASFTDMNNNTIGNIDNQIASYQKMIKAEESKKKTDNGRIEEWKENIKQLEKTKKELQQQATEELGGIGETNYKDAAQQFADAWVDAFNETGDGIEALQDTFDNLITNMIKKQAMMRLVQARLKSVFEAIDKSVDKSSDGGANLTKEELKTIELLGKNALEGLNEDFLNLMDTLGYVGTSKKSELSALTQSVEGITEKTAEELSALLNSVRFFVAQQTSDVSAIRTLLDSVYSMNSVGTGNPMLVELKSQTGYLEIISDRIGRVFAPSANSKGAGLRVFIQ